MLASIRGSVCEVVREKGDPKLRGGTWGSAESQFFHRLRNVLRGQGHDVVQRRMQADGHMMGDEWSQYLRERKWAWCVVDEQWAIRDVAKEFNEGGKVSLAVVRWSERRKPCMSE
jgi:hypothetical protein